METDPQRDQAYHRQGRPGAILYGKENAASQDGLMLDEQGFRHGFGEEGAWRTFPHPEAATPRRGEPILVAGRMAPASPC